MREIQLIVKIFNPPLIVFSNLGMSLKFNLFQEKLFNRTK